jgi:DNA-binding PadR family transcriptional regulator
MPEMSANAYAILGLLAARPWSAYELARHMKTSSNLRQIWPRAESKIYQAPKQLEAAGWAKGRKERNGGRERTVYRITPKGRRALRKWLDVPAASPHFELEVALKVAYATAGTVDQLKETLRNLEDRRRGRLKGLSVGLRELLDEGFTIPERAHTSALVAGLGARLAKAMGEWNEWAQQTVADWDDMEIDDEKRAWAKSTYEELAAELDQFLLSPFDNDPPDRKSGGSSE